MTYWIRDYLGTSAADEICDPGVVVVDVRDLVDGTNKPAVIWQKIKTALAVLKLNDKVVVQCAAGISRSNAIAAAVFAIREGFDYSDALRIVIGKVPRANPNLEIKESVRAAITRYNRKRRPAKTTKRARRRRSSR